MNRRQFLKGSAVILAVPAYVKFESLMKPRNIWTPPAYRAVDVEVFVNGEKIQGLVDDMIDIIARSYHVPRHMLLGNTK